MPKALQGPVDDSCAKGDRQRIAQRARAAADPVQHVARGARAQARIERAQHAVGEAFGQGRHGALPKARA
jgi:hypothetical protein